uniref:Predicted protein n=1 Tax=Hordeum vulgare subsp. vulgare TaxID=112509 RepID=F2DA38_HORVV|nr:predicted protein [Hordeum vulgare subsp. vulgare]
MQWQCEEPIRLQETYRSCKPAAHADAADAEEQLATNTVKRLCLFLLLIYSSIKSTEH